jgi:hypothetical protein
MFGWTTRPSRNGVFLESGIASCSLYGRLAIVSPRFSSAGILTLATALEGGTVASCLVVEATLPYLMDITRGYPHVSNNGDADTGGVQLLAAAEATRDDAPLIPRDVLFGNPKYNAPTLSPDGRHLVHRAPSGDIVGGGGVLNVWVRRTFDAGIGAANHQRFVAWDPPREVGQKFARSALPAGL